MNSHALKHLQRAMQLLNASKYSFGNEYDDSPRPPPKRRKIVDDDSEDEIIMLSDEDEPNTLSRPSRPSHPSHLPSASTHSTLPTAIDLTLDGEPQTSTQPSQTITHPLRPRTKTQVVGYVDLTKEEPEEPEESEEEPEEPEYPDGLPDTLLDVANVDNDTKTNSLKEFNKQMKKRFEEHPYDESVQMYNVDFTVDSEGKEYSRLGVSKPSKKSIRADGYEEERKRIFNLVKHTLLQPALTDPSKRDIRLQPPSWFDNSRRDWNALNIQKLLHRKIKWPKCDREILNSQYVKYQNTGKCPKKGFVLSCHLERRPGLHHPLEGVVLYTAPSTLGPEAGKGLFTNVDLPPRKCITAYAGLFFYKSVHPSYHNTDAGESTASRPCICRLLKDATEEQRSALFKQVTWASVSICCLYKNTHKMRPGKVHTYVGVDGVNHSSVEGSEYGVGVGAASWLNNPKFEDPENPNPTTHNFDYNCVFDKDEGSGLCCARSLKHIARGSELFIKYDDVGGAKQA